MIRQIRATLRPEPSRGWAVFVEGGAGMGKTAVLSDCTRAVGSAGVRVIIATGDEALAHKAFGALSALLPDPDSADDPVEAAGQRVDEWCGGGPVLIWIDDAQQLDKGSLTVLARLWTAARDLPLTVLISARPTPDRPELAELAASATLRVTLPGLDSDDVAALAADHLGYRPNAAQLEALAAADGNPFAVSVMLELPASARASAEAAIGAGTDAVTAAVRSQLALLADELLDVVTSVAVLGAPVDPTQIAAMLQQPLASLDPIIDQATAAGVLERSAEAVVFRHHAYAEVVLADLAPQLRRSLHREALRVLRADGAPDGRLAEQALRAGDASAVGFVRTLTAATSRIAPGVVADLLGEVMPLAAPGEAEEMIADRAQALFLAGRGQQAEDLIRAQLPRTADPAVRARMASLSLRSLVNRANTAGALAEIANLLANVGLPTTVRRELEGLRCWVLLLAGDIRTALGEADRLIIEAPDDLAREQVRGHTRTTRACGAWLHARPLDALAIVAEVRDQSDATLGDDHLTAPVWPPKFAVDGLGLTQARALHESGRARSTGGGTRWVAAFHDFVGAGISFAAGEWDDAIAGFDAGLDLASESGTGWLSMAGGARALIDVHRGELIAARARLDDIARAGYPDQFGQRWPALVDLLLREAVLWNEFAAGAGAIRADDEARLAATASRIWDDAVARGSELWLAEIAVDIARCADTKLFERVARDVAALTPTQLRTDAFRDQIAAMHRQDPGLLVDAAERLDDSGDRIAAGRAWEEAGLQAARSGQASIARRALRSAIEGYNRLGAVTDVTRARARAHRLGLRQAGPPQRRRSELTGWPSLTPTELTVAELIRKGNTNPEIARQLFLSPRTVQTHVSHILRKTDLRSRVEIAAAAMN